MITLKNVSFEYSNEDIILDNANATISKDKITVVLGKNGVGKTTLLSLIDGYLTIDSGEIIKQSDSAYIYDSPYLYEYLTGNEYLSLIKSISSQKTHIDIDDMIKELELDGDMDKLISNYSLGMKHKLALLSSLLLNYDLYLIDEPLASLDPDSQKFMIDFFRKMKEKQKTLLISTHMLHVAYTLADEIIIFKQNQLSKFANNYSTYEEFENFVLHNLRVDI